MSARAADRGVVGWLLAQTRGLLPPLALAVGFGIVNAGAGVAVALLALAAVGSAAGVVDAGLGALLLWLVAAAGTKAVARYLEQYTGHFVAFAALARLRNRFFAALSPQAPGGTARLRSGELSQLATRDIDRVEVFFAHTVPPAVVAVVVPGAGVAAVAALGHPLLAAPLAAALLVAIGLPLATTRRTGAGAARAAAARGALAQRVTEDLQGARELAAFDAVDVGLDRAAAAGADLDAAAGTVQRQRVLRAGVVEAAQGLGHLGVLTAGAALAADGAVALTAVVAALVVSVAVAGPARAIDGFAADLSASLASARRLRAVMEREPAVVDPDRPTAIPAGVPVLEAAGVTFTQPGAAAPALADASVRIDPGEHVAIVGASGSGKSTFLGLLTRWWDPDAGAVTVGGIDVRDVAQDDLRRRVGSVAQRPALFSGTLADLLRLGRPDADDDELVDALRVAGLDGWLAGQTAGLATRIPEGGRRFSGGQRQRLALARTLVQAPDVLVLDEALGQLDQATEAEVRERLGAWRGKRTLIEVTHRVERTLDADRVVVVDAGRIVEIGAPAALAAAGGAFAALLDRRGAS